jgi:VanZ family protein
MRFFKYHLPVIFYASGLFILSSITISADVLPVFANSDKIFHALIYCPFAFLILRSLHVSNPGKTALSLKITSFTAAFSYGIIIEIYQHFLPTRSMELMDIFSNGIGALIGVLFFSKMQSIKTNKGKANVKDNIV